MLSFPVKGTSRSCGGITRRDFFTVGSLGLGGLTLPGLLGRRAAAQASSRRGEDTAVVWLFLSGGPSHLDTYDMKPNAPAEFRGPFHPVHTNVPGLDICHLMPRQAQVMDKMALVRTLSHGDGNHGSAVHWVATGVLFPPADRGEPQIAPFPGSVAARVRGPNRHTGMPPYHSLHRMPTSDGPAFLGVGCAPFAAHGPARENMSLQSATTVGRLRDRRALLRTFDTVRRDLDAGGTMEAMDSIQQQAYELILGRGARDAYDLSLEPRHTVDRYGPGLGEQLLIARRLCEAGAGFVSIEYSGRDLPYGWDNHRGVFTFLENNLPVLDHAVATFVDDVAQRGLADRILLVVMGEMGRTPRINEFAGRDHWPQVMFALMAGGGLRMGQAIGRSSAKGEAPVGRSFSAQDLLATIYHVLGIDLGLQFSNHSGRLVPILTEGRPIADLV